MTTPHDGATPTDPFDELADALEELLGAVEDVNYAFVNDGLDPPYRRAAERARETLERWHSGR